MKTINKFVLYALILVSGASTMIFELVMPRLFAPFFGTTTYIWTIIIGVVMLSLSIGYYLGGKLADSKPSFTTLSYLFLSASVIGFLICLSKDLVLIEPIFRYKNAIYSAFITTLWLLAPINIIFGMITPMAVKLRISALSGAGSAAGNMYALSTVGSIAGTFGTGFWLLPTYSISQILLYASTLLGICAIASIPSILKKVQIFLVVMLCLFFYHLNSPENIFKNYYENQFRVKLVTDLETKYSRVWAYDQNYSGRVERVMSDSQSTLVLNQPITATMEDRLSYYSYFNLFDKSRQIDSVLMVGGGAYTYANYLQYKYPNLKIDVVEIDPELLTVAQQYFNFKPGKNFHNYNLDGRNFLNINTKKYDIIFLDAYQNGGATPFQLITQEAMGKIHNSLTENGELYVNVISSLTGSSKDLLLSEYKTVTSVFKFTDVFPVFQTDPAYRQNYVIVGKKNERKLDSHSAGLNAPISSMDQYLTNQKVLTDDYAPVEYFDLQSIL